MKCPWCGSRDLRNDGDMEWCNKCGEVWIKAREVQSE